MLGDGVNSCCLDCIKRYSYIHINPGYMSCGMQCETCLSCPAFMEDIGQTW